MAVSTFCVPRNINLGLLAQDLKYLSHSWRAIDGYGIVLILWSTITLALSWNSYWRKTIQTRISQGDTNKKTTVFMKTSFYSIVQSNPTFYTHRESIRTNNTFSSTLTNAGATYICIHSFKQFIIFIKCNYYWINEFWFNIEPSATHWNLFAFTQSTIKLKRMIL